MRHIFRRAFRFIGRSVFLQDILTLIQVFYNCVFFGNCTQRVGQKFAPRCSLYSLSSLSTKLISSCYSTSVTAAKISFYPDDTRSRYFTRKAAFSVLQKTGDWRRRAAEPVDRGQPGQWLRTVEDDLRPLNFSLATASTQEHALERETKSVSRLARLACLLAQVFFSYTTFLHRIFRTSLYKHLHQLDAGNLRKTVLDISFMYDKRFLLQFIL